MNESARPSPTFTTEEGPGWFVIAWLSLVVFGAMLDNRINFL